MHADAAACSSACPAGVDSECDLGQTCFLIEICGPSSAAAPSMAPLIASPAPESPQMLAPMTPGAVVVFPVGGPAPGPAGTEDAGAFCGEEYVDAQDCADGTACPGGLDSECPDGSTCFAVEECASGSVTITIVPGESENFCGVDYEEARECVVACPGGLDGECAVGQTCYAVEVGECAEGPSGGDVDDAAAGGVAPDEAAPGGEDATAGSPGLGAGGVFSGVTGLGALALVWGLLVGAALV